MATRRETGDVTGVRENIATGPTTPGEQLPEGWTFIEAVGAATDCRDRVYVFNRGEHPVIVFDRDGRFVTRGAKGASSGRTASPSVGMTPSTHRRHRPHRPQVHPRRRAAADAGHERQALRHRREGHRLPHHQRGGPPFNQPTNLALAPDGTLYVTDGYGNARVHKFSPDGRLLFSWGEPGERARPVPPAARHRRGPRRAACTSPTARTAACSSSRRTAVS